jgi:hypothetical protein
VLLACLPVGPAVLTQARLAAPVARACSREEKDEASRALAQAELDSKRALSSVAGYHKSAQVGSTAVRLAVAVDRLYLGCSACCLPPSCH